MNLQFRRKAYDQAGSFAELISTRCALDANTLLTKGGDLLRVFKVQGQDYEGLDAAAMESSCQSMRAALKQLGDGITLYQVHIRRNGASVPAEVHPENPIVKRATENRHAFFQSKADRKSVV